MGNDERYIKEVVENDENTVKALIADSTGEIVSTVIVSKHPILRPKPDENAVPPTILASPLWCYSCRKIGIQSGPELDDPYPFLKDGWLCLVKWAVDEQGRGPNDGHDMVWFCPECRKEIQLPEVRKLNDHS